MIFSGRGMLEVEDNIQYNIVPVTKTKFTRKLAN